MFVNESKSAPDNVTGFTVDILRELAKRLDFDYEFVLLRGGGSAKFVEALKAKVIRKRISIVSHIFILFQLLLCIHWLTPDISCLLQKVDMAIGSFTITANREKDIDFCKPFMDFKMALILRIPKEKESLFNFHKPFSGDVWLMVVLTVFAICISTFDSFHSNFKPF